MDGSINELDVKQVSLSILYKKITYFWKLFLRHFSVDVLRNSADDTVECFYEQALTDP